MESGVNGMNVHLLLHFCLFDHFRQYLEDLQNRSTTICFVLDARLCFLSIKISMLY